MTRTRTILTTLLLATTLPGLAACGDSKPAAGGNVTMRDMEVVDGTANDSMTDLDNATQDGTLLSNIGDVPVKGTEGATTSNSSDAGTSGDKIKTGEPGGNDSTAE